MIPETLMIPETKKYAVKCHANVNHRYGNHSYDFHLEKVYMVGLKFMHLIKEEERSNVLSACWCHDLVEDTRETYNDVKKATNERVADIVYALTNEKGKSRTERANHKYYFEMRQVYGATFVKICDRIANVEYSKESGSSMFEKYKKENDNFVDQMGSPELNEMIEYLKNLFVD